jgi:hypothetical protein
MYRVSQLQDKLGVEATASSGAPVARRYSVTR